MMYLTEEWWKLLRRSDALLRKSSVEYAKE
jgi:hypothetical protein